MLTSIETVLVKYLEKAKIVLALNYRLKDVAPNRYFLPTVFRLYVK